MTAVHTGGPWYWHVDSNGRISLRTPDRGQLIVMDFARVGMQAAGPRFAYWDGMEDGKPRARLGGILMAATPNTIAGHPDAKLMEAAPDLLAALKLARECIAYCRRAHKDVQTGDGVPAEYLIDEVIAKAEGRS